MSRYILIFLALLVPSVSSADQQKASVSFAETLLAIDTLAGDFRQRIVDGDGSELQVTEGEFKVKRPGYFLWKIAPPYEQLVVGTPQSLKVYDPDLEQMSVHKQDSLSGTPASLISGDVAAISQLYEVDQAIEKDTSTFFLRQKNTDQGSFDSLTFVFITKGEQLKLNQMIFVDKLGQKTEITISKLKTNKKITDNTFQFEPPSGTDIIIDG